MSIFSIGLSGLQAASDDLEGISQNISNSSTAGYKSVSTQYEASYSGGSGSGVAVSGTTQSFDVDGDMIETDDDLDLAISGSGFFVLSNGDGTYAYSRNGDFSLDSDYNVVATNGMNVQGYSVDENGNIAYGTITNLSITQTSIPAEASTEVELTANLNADATTIDTSTTTFDPTDGSTYNYSISTEVYDSEGTSHTLSEYYVKTGDNTWSVYYTMDGTTLTTTDSSGNTTNVTTELTFSTTGTLTSPTNDVTLTFSMGGAVNDITLSIDVSDITQYASDFSSSSDADGYTSGALSSAYFDSDGYLWATYDNGETVLRGQVVLASFSNPDGLESSSGTVWYATNDSGSPTYGTAGSGSFSSLTVGYYENSNVDISSELVDLMAAQQTYQANAKTLTAADEMASVLFNI